MSNKNMYQGNQFLNETERFHWLTQNTDILSSDVDFNLVSKYKKDLEDQKLKYCKETSDLLDLHERIQWTDPTCNEKRQMRITATNAASIIGQDKYCSKEQLYKIKTKQVPPKPTNFIMQRGIDTEAEGLKMFEYFSGIELVKDKPIGFVLCRKKPSIFGCTPDGVGIWYPCLVELKCPFSRKITHEVPKHYMPQVQFQLYVCNMPFSFFVQYKPPSDHGDRGVIDILKVDRDEGWMTEYEPFFLDFHARVLAYITHPDFKETSGYARSMFIKEQEKRRKVKENKKRKAIELERELNSDFLFVEDDV